MIPSPRTPMHRTHLKVCFRSQRDGNLVWRISDKRSDIEIETDTTKVSIRLSYQRGKRRKHVSSCTENSSETLATFSCVRSISDFMIAAHVSATSLSTLFQRCQAEVLDSVLTRVPLTLRRVCKAIFSWKIAARRPIKRYELIEALVLDHDPGSTPVIGEEALRKCEDTIYEATGSLIAFDEDDNVQFIDQAVMEHLTVGNTEFGISRADAEEFLSISISRYLSNGGIENDLNSHCKSRSSICSIQIEDFFSHCERAEASGKPVAGFVFNFLKSKNFGIWRELFTQSNRDCETELALSDPFTLAAKFGLYSFAKMLLSMGFRVKDQKAANIALANRHMQVHFLLHFAAQIYRPPCSASVC